MFKGIQNTLKLLAITMMTLPLMSHADQAEEIFTQCSNGSYNPDVRIEHIAGKDTVRDTGKTSGYRVVNKCYRLTCQSSTPGVGTIDFGDDVRNSDSVKNKSRSAGIYSHIEEKCRDEKTKISKVERGELFDGDTTATVSGGGGASGGGEFVIKWGDRTLICQNETDYQCLERHGIPVAGITLNSRTIGTDGQGRRIIVVSAGGNIDTDVGVTSTGQIDARCLERKCRWLTLCIKKKWVLDKDCVGAGAGTSGAVDILIGGDIDLGAGTRRGAGTWYTDRRTGRRYKCAYSNQQRCIQDLMNRGILSADYNIDRLNCPHCESRYRYSSRYRDGNSWSGILNGIAAVSGAILPSYFMYKGMKVNAKAQLGIAEAYANGAVGVAEQCQIMQTTAINAHYANIANNEFPNADPNIPTCNGYSIGQFPGNQGWGSNGWGSWGNASVAAGYDPRFLALMSGGGNAMINPYLNVTGLNGIPGAGLTAGANLNLNTLLGLPPNGINLAAGVNGNLASCITFPCPNVNSAAGWNFNTPYANPNFALQAQLNNNWRTGWPNSSANAWLNPSWNATSRGLVPWQPGGSSANGNNWWSRSSYDTSTNFMAQQYQQLALQNSASRALNNLNYAGGVNSYNAAYSPFNIGGTASLQLGLW